MIRAIELAGRFSIPNLVFGSPRQRVVPPELTAPDALEQAAELFWSLGDRARAAGTKIAIEANPAAYGTNFLTTLSEALAFIQQVDHPAIAAILDLGAMHMNGEYDAVVEQLPKLMPRLNHVHVSEPQLAPAPRCAEDLAPVLSALQELEYAGAVSIEMKRPERGLREVEAAVSLLARAAQGMEQSERACHA